MLCNENTCIGCGACQESCQKNCISMTLSEHGIAIPQIDESKCIHCNECVKSCPILNDMISIPRIYPQIYRSYIKNANVLKDSASGGIFTAFAQFILERGGVVCGAVMESDFTVKYKIITKACQLAAMRSSKYVQSLPDRNYAKIKIYLEEGKMVLFSGLPCHVAGLYQYLKQDYNNLYTIDIVCHGTSSTTLFQKYVKFTEKEYHDQLISINQTSKEKGWNILIPRTIQLKFESGKVIYRNSWEDFYLSRFLSNLFFKPACYHCKFATLPRVSDITLGDFFGIGTVKSAKNLNKYGESMVSVNTSKGNELFSFIENDIYSERRELKEVLYFNHNMWKPSKKNKYWQNFYTDMLDADYEKLKDKYFDSSKKTKFNILIRQLLKRMLGYKMVAKCMLFVYKRQGICDIADEIISNLHKQI